MALVNTSGHVVSSEELQVSEENGRYKVTILTTVSETGLVRCRVKQKEICHEAFTDVFVYIHGKITFSGSVNYLLLRYILTTTNPFKG